MLLNKQRALAMMKEARLDALIATTPENVCYMTEVMAWPPRVYKGNTPEKGMQQYAILTREGARILLISLDCSLSHAYKAQLDDIWAFGPPISVKPEGYEPKLPEEKLVARLMDSKTRRTVDAGSALIGALKQIGVTQGRVGIEFYNLAPSCEAALRAEFGRLELVEAGELFRRIRYVKTPDEIHRLRLAALVNEDALHEVIKALRPGVTERELRKVFKAALGAQDASQDFFTCSGGLRASLWAGTSDYRFQRGDMVVMDPGCELNYYHADTGICGVLGEPTKAQLDGWRKQWDVWEAGLEVLGPGVSPVKVYDAMAAAQKKHFGVVHGFFGHGIGIEPRELPLINKVPGTGTKLWDMEGAPPFELGMVIELEIPFPVMGGTVYHIEEAFIITETGHESLIDVERDLFTFPT